MDVEGHCLPTAQTSLLDEATRSLVLLGVCLCDALIERKGQTSVRKSRTGMQKRGHQTTLQI